MMNTRRQVINKAKELAKADNHFRFFSINGEVWECYQSEYLPDIGQRAWFAEPIRYYTIEDGAES